MSWMIACLVAALLLHMVISAVLWGAQTQAADMIDIGVRDRLLALFWLPAFFGALFCLALIGCFRRMRGA